MKKFGILTLLLVFFMNSCSTSKVARQNESAFKGDWTLNEIVSDQGQNVVITNLLNHSSLECFEGSNWHLVANNNTGYYTLEGGNCDTTPTNIKWYMQEEGDGTYFWFKRVGEGQKAKNVVSGYKMKVISITDTDAHLLHEVPFEGGKMAIHYYFVKQ